MLLNLFHNQGKGQPVGGDQAYVDKVLRTEPDNLIAYWPMWETSGNIAQDISGNVRNGAYTGVTLGQSGIGDGNTSPLFDGTSDYLNAYSTSLRDAFNGSEGSFILWYKHHVNSHNDSIIRRMLYTFIDSDNYIILAKTGTNSDVQVDYKAGGIAEQGTISIATYNTSFNMFGLTWSKTSERTRYYHNNTLHSFDTALGVWSGDIPDFMIGATNTVPTSPYYGSLCHAVIWDIEISQTKMERLGIV